MNVLIVALFLIVAFVNGQQDDLMEETMKAFESSPCYPCMKKFIDELEKCEGFTSSLFNDEQLDSVLPELYKKRKDQHTDRIKKSNKKDEREFIEYSEYRESMKTELCTLEKLGLVNADTKTIDAEKYIGLFEGITNETVKSEMTAIIKECVAEKSTSELKFITQDDCFAQKTEHICVSEELAEILHEWDFKKSKDGEESQS